MNSATDRAMQIAFKRAVARGVCEFTLTDPDSTGLPPWEPGAHIDIHVNGFVRQYSLCGDPDDQRHWKVAVLRTEDSRGGSEFLHDRAEVGDLLPVGGPRNHFPLVPGERFLFVAGGIGITPLLPMIRHLARHHVPVRLAYGGRDLGSMAYAAELTDIPGLALELYPYEESGLLPVERLISGVDDETQIYCCGPEGLLHAVESTCADYQKPRLHIERFAPAPASTGPNAPFAVELAQSGLLCHVDASESILEAVRKGGVDVPSSCAEGVCGTCETDVLAGLPDHRDSFLTEDERALNDRMMICVSRSKSERLVLDL